MREDAEEQDRRREATEVCDRQEGVLVCFWFNLIHLFYELPGIGDRCAFGPSPNGKDVLLSERAM